MAANEKCGIYQILCRQSGGIYVGSSKQIYTRWSQHRSYLRKGTSVCVLLQKAWSKHGEDAFQFSVIEECAPEQLEAREQFYIDTLEPKYNSITDIQRRSGAEMLAKRAAKLRARAAAITHCPRGHAYDEANTYINKKGKRICRACNALRVSGVYAAETLEEREARRQRVNAYNDKSRPERLAKQREYTAAHKAEKMEYDRLHRAEKKAYDAARRKKQKEQILQE